MKFIYHDMQLCKILLVNLRQLQNYNVGNDIVLIEKLTQTWPQGIQIEVENQEQPIFIQAEIRETLTQQIHLFM